jgi:small conductance mechanosensitive channel
MGDLKTYTDDAIKLIMTYVPKLLLAIVVLLIGLWLIKILVKFIRKAMEAGGTDASLQKFLLSLINILLKVLLLISVASMVGIATTSFVAILGAAGLAIGLALSGNLSNFAGGVLILFLKPFKVGDFINAQGHAGVVHEIQVFHTILKTPDNKTIIIPNGILSNGSIINFSTESQRRVDLFFGINYTNDIQKAKAVFNKVAESDARILKKPAPEFLVSELGESAINFEVRLWCKTDDYWDVFYGTKEKVKIAFDKEGITAPIPQRIFIQQK